MVKNEQDIIEPFVRHTARFVDAVVILDNASVDETRRIVVACARELGTVVISDSTGFAYTQAERMTELLRHCQSAFFADFVLFLDADEFIGAADRASLLASLETIPAAGVGYMEWQTFVLGPDDGDASDPPQCMRRRRKVEHRRFYKAALRLDGAHRPGLQVVQGNHDVLDEAGERLTGVTLDEVRLLHFPVRSRGQLVTKGVVGWMATLAGNPDAAHGEQGFQWRDAFERAVSTIGGLGAVDASSASLAYAQDARPGDLLDTVEDKPPAYERRHSTGAYGDPLVLMALSWQRSLVPPKPVIELIRPASASGQGLAGTSFDSTWHWDFLFVDVAPFRFIAEKHCPLSVLDVGCGIGAYLQLCKRLGAKRVLGIDGVPADATVLETDEYLLRDLGNRLELGLTFDLVICVEVAEHLEARHADTLLDSIARHASGTIVFSAAEPNQPGHGHINGQPIAYWLDAWARRGWYPDLVDSLGMRALATTAWFRRNLMVLRRTVPASGVASLKMIGERRFNWYGQEPGIRESALCEPLRGPPAGYEAA